MKLQKRTGIPWQDPKEGIPLMVANRLQGKKIHLNQRKPSHAEQRINDEFTEEQIYNWGHSGLIASYRASYGQRRWFPQTGDVLVRNRRLGSDHVTVFEKIGETDQEVGYIVWDSPVFVSDDFKITTERVYQVIKEKINAGVFTSGQCRRIGKKYLLNEEIVQAFGEAQGWERRRDLQANQEPTTSSSPPERLESGFNSRGSLGKAFLRGE